MQYTSFVQVEIRPVSENSNVAIRPGNGNADDADPSRSVVWGSTIPGAYKYRGCFLLSNSHFPSDLNGIREPDMAEGRRAILFLQV